MDSAEDSAPLLLTALDVRKAFDVVDHEILKFRLLQVVRDPTLWKVTVDLLTNSEAKVRVQGQFGPPISILQGVGQGRILSPLEYKVYINPLLTALRKMASGSCLGIYNAGFPTCADDIILASDGELAQQTQLSLVTGFAEDNHYDIHPTKSKTVSHGKVGKEQLLINTTPVPYVESLIHLGIERTDNRHCPDATIEKKIKTVRRATYALMGPGLHGINSMNPKSARSLLQAYIVPRLLYGLETMVLTQKQFNSIETYFRSLLKQVQSLPDNVANPAPYILIGLCPIEATYDKNLVSLLAAALGDSSIRQLALHRFATKSSRSKSWFIYAQKRLSKYPFYSPGECLSRDLDPAIWASYMKTCIEETWERSLVESAASYPSLRYLGCQDKLFKKAHPIWETGNHDSISTQQAIINAQLATGTYRLQANRATFNQFAVSPDCPLCHSGAENRSHFLLQCKALDDIRDTYLPKIQDCIRNNLGIEISKLEVDSLLDPSTITDYDTRHMEGLQAVFMLTKRYMYKLHCRRRILITLICWDSTGYELFCNLLRGSTWKGVRLKTRTRWPCHDVIF